MKEKKLDGLGEKLTSEHKMKKKTSIDHNLGCLRWLYFCSFFSVFDLFESVYALIIYEYMFMFLYRQYYVA